MIQKQDLLDNIKTSLKEYGDNYFDFSFKPDNPIVRLHEPTICNEEIFAAVETMLSTFTTMGRKVRAFEKQYADYTHSQYSVMSNSGSSANLLSVAALANPCTRDHLKPGDEVIVPALSWSTTIWPIIQYNLIPVIVDCSLDNLNIDLDKLEKAIGPKTRAIMLVHVYGNPCNMDGIMAIAKKHNLILIEDACEAMGASYDEKAIGSFGQIGNFSFFFSHHISTMEGGISICNDFDLTETMRILRAHGWSRESDQHQKYVNMYPEIDPRFIFINLGYNLRPTEVNAAIAQIQLPKLDEIIAIRRELANFYLHHLSKYEDFFYVQKVPPKGKHSWFGFTLVLKDNAPFSLKDITTYLQQHHIETRPIIAGNMARHPALKLYSHRIAGDLSGADTVMKKGFAMPCHHAVDQFAREYVINTIDSFIDNAVLSPSSHRIHKKAQSELEMIIG